MRNAFDRGIVDDHETRERVRAPQSRNRVGCDSNKHGRRQIAVYDGYPRFRDKHGARPVTSLPRVRAGLALGVR